jgi:hypothetical protein
MHTFERDTVLRHGPEVVVPLSPDRSRRRAEHVADALLSDVSEKVPMHEVGGFGLLGLAQPALDVGQNGSRGVGAPIVVEEGRDDRAELDVAE